MTEPQIRYVTSADGTRIATASLGGGTPLVVIPASGTHIESTFSSPETGAVVDYFAERHRFITYDPRGRGLSDRNPADWSLPARVADLLAVFQGLMLEPAFLIGRVYASMIGIAFAAQHPQHIRRLGLSVAMARGTDVEAGLADAFDTLTTLRDVTWAQYCQFLALIWFGWTESGQAFAERMSQAFTPQSWTETIRAARQDDVSEYLDQIVCPTLIIQPHGTEHIIRAETVREVAARVKDARFRTSDVTAWIPSIGMDAAKAFVEFFQEDEDLVRAEPQLPTGTAIILFADIVGSTALTERLGDAAFRAKARDLDASLRALVRECGGTPVEGPTLGDGVLAVFTSAREAIEAARRCAKAGDDAGLPLHLGLHAGDVSREKDPDGRDNVYGGAVNIAARISGLSAAGEVLVSETVRSLARTSAGVAFEDRGEQALKGVGEAVRVWAVREGV